ncbi:hypothetical protein DRP43_01235 [candidate division TA06 bacterium]|uniref:Uncharacterized protein n=1 Tax=candidate division TA06 bacterium TaxID=2250710 RepID=A0A660SQN5_UNCT6|nr:MAG: hypothetical protein DRP43_01235 [candidate division TA06 bacterium]
MINILKATYFITIIRKSGTVDLKIIEDKDYAIIYILYSYLSFFMNSFLESINYMKVNLNSILLNIYSIMERFRG